MITPLTSAIRNNNKPRILIVDDNPRFSHSARLILQQSGQYIVCEENDAAGAVETARGGPEARPLRTAATLCPAQPPIRMRVKS